MTDLQDAFDDLLAAFERHPGHSPQSVHGGKGKGKAAVKKIVSAFGEEVELPDHKPTRPPRKPKPLGSAGPEFKAQVKAKMATENPNWADKGSSGDDGGGIGQQLADKAASDPNVHKDYDPDEEPATFEGKMSQLAVFNAKQDAGMKVKAPAWWVKAKGGAGEGLQSADFGALKGSKITPRPKANDAKAKVQADQQATFQAKMKELADWQAGLAPIPAWYEEMNEKKLGGKKPRDADDGLFFHRGYTAERGGSPGDPIRFLASTPGVKRDGLDLRAGGWRLDNYRKNPVFQWCHDKTMPPLGRVDAEAKGNLLAAVTFDQEDDFARKAESKYRRGFLHSVSVGWDFVDGHGTRLNTGRLSLDEIRDRAFYDLTEISGVPVPADPDALVQRQRSGLRSLGRELVALYDEQEHGDALAEEVRQALDDELERLGIPIGLLQRFAAHTQPANPAGFFVPETTAPAVPAIDRRAARNLAAAFTFLKEPTR